MYIWYDEEFSIFSWGFGIFEGAAGNYIRNYIRASLFYSILPKLWPSNRGTWQNIARWSHICPVLQLALFFFLSTSDFQLYFLYSHIDLSIITAEWSLRLHLIPYVRRGSSLNSYGNRAMPPFTLTPLRFRWAIK